MQIMLQRAAEGLYIWPMYDKYMSISLHKV